MNTYFITGTDTGIGKTTVSAIITLALNATYWKPIQCGAAKDVLDKDQVQQLTGLSDSHFSDSAYVLQASLSPDQAADIENITINIEQCKVPEVSTSNFIVEGAGGVFVPLNQTHCMIDLMQRFNFPAIIVARGTLGTVNHTLLTIQALRQRNIPIKGVVFCGELNPANQLAIEKWGKVDVLFHFPPIENLTKAVLQQFVSDHKKKIVGALL